MLKRITLLCLLTTLPALSHTGPHQAPQNSSDFGWALLSSMALLITVLVYARRRRLLLCLLALLTPALALAVKNQVNIRLEGDNRVIQSNGVPQHEVGPRRGNPFQIAAQHYQFRVPVAPVEANQLTPVGMNRFGVAIDGVPFDPATAEFWQGDRRWNVNAFAVDLGIDDYNAHIQPNGAYHYHGIPWNYQEQKLIGYAADGFKIYNPLCEGTRVKPSYHLRPGNRPYDSPGGTYDGTYTADFEYLRGRGDLDECNGHRVNGEYHYHLTTAYPFVPRYWRGEPDFSFFKHPPRR